ncbi:unnamed protein product [Acanthoscelides obtectus]|uniref:Uncharacterized protein n=1 Tax=Acanthoscelides obtectus TaxID=200917 RepID=A0A9P0JWC3_ACAOB|nr:unnamed protein product [Acanthoscelides obtectus]CAK1663746.1 hypothetical protein AOBTE_LOCUS23834 [Acanthoscelides obtectus]
MKLFAEICIFLCALAMVVAYRLPVDDQNRPQRHIRGHYDPEAVDFGAHTGNHGAFGWHADFPVSDR